MILSIGTDRGNEMFEELGISFGTALIVLLALYFIVKWAVKNGIKEAYRDITGKVTTEDIEAEQICNEEGNYSVGLRTCCADRKNT